MVRTRAFYDAQEGNFLPLGNNLLRHLEGDVAAAAETDEEIGSLRLQGTHLFEEVRCPFLNALKFLTRVWHSCFESVNGLVQIEKKGDFAECQDAGSVATRDPKEGRPRTGGLDGHCAMKRQGLLARFMNLTSQLFDRRSLEDRRQRKSLPKGLLDAVAQPHRQ